MTKWTAIAFLVLIMHAGNALAQKKPMPKETNVVVALSCSVQEYDPSKPSKAVIKCVVRNSTDRPIQVPAGYDGKLIRLVSARTLTLYAVKEDDAYRLERKIKVLKRKLAATDDPDRIMVLARELAETIKSKKKQQAQGLTPIKPGQERVVFEFPLDEILVQGKTKDGTFRWTWDRRPAPPKSPLYIKAGSQDLIQQVALVVRLQLGGEIVNSKTVRLKVKAGG